MMRGLEQSHRSATLQHARNRLLHEAVMRDHGVEIVADNDDPDAILWAHRGMCAASARSGTMRLVPTFFVVLEIVQQ
jgi:hypothetical protein